MWQWYFAQPPIHLHTGILTRRKSSRIVQFPPPLCGGDLTGCGSGRVLREGEAVFWLRGALGEITVFGRFRVLWLKVEVCSRVNGGLNG
jgi:hypothetical protein